MNTAPLRAGAELGGITFGRRADMVLTSDLRNLPIETVFALGSGSLKTEHGRLPALPVAAGRARDRAAGQDAERIHLRHRCAARE